ncbi:MAG: hypothetical protein NTW67_03330 [Candidatus Woesearchaeota archaeon]|nr:hypothetical protein [Candidatus Woesearchaeota archaeon]
MIEKNLPESKKITSAGIKKTSFGPGKTGKKAATFGHQKMRVWVGCERINNEHHQALQRRRK